MNAMLRLVRDARTTAMAVVLVLAQLATEATGDAATASDVEAGGYVKVVQTRIVETSNGTGADRGPMRGNQVIAVGIAGHHGVPARGASAVAITVTTAAASARGAINIYSGTGARPAWVTMNYRPGPRSTTTAIVALGGDGSIRIANQGAGHVQLAVDLAGWYEGGAVHAAGMTVPVRPVAVVDNSTGSRNSGALTAGGQSRSPRVLGVGQVPASGVSAVLVQLSALSPTAGGQILAHAPSARRTPFQTLSFARDVAANSLMVVPVSAGRVQFDVRSKGLVRLLAVVVGYVTAGSGVDTGAFAEAPTGAAVRVLDTRPGRPAGIPGDRTVTVPVVARAKLPSLEIEAVLLRVTSAGSTASGTASIRTAAATPARGVVLTWAKGRTTSNLVIAPVEKGRVLIHVSTAGRTGLVADVVGYYRSDPADVWQQTVVRGLPVGATLSHVSCVAKSCLAVGSDPLTQQPFAITGSGATWSAPVPLRRPTGATSFGIQDVVCTAPQECESVGYYTDDNDVVLPLVESWNGSGWSVQNVPLPADLDSGFLTDISCGRGFCVAAGSAASGWVAVLGTGGGATSSAHISGATWTSQDAPGIDPSDPSTLESFDSVACAGGSERCVAFGRREADDAFLVFSYDGGTWRVTARQAPGSEATFPVVSCLDAASCLGSGETFDETGEIPEPVPYLVRVHAGVTSRFTRIRDVYVALSCVQNECVGATAHGLVVVAGDRQAGAPLLPRGITSVTYADLSCTAEQNCTAVGSATRSSGAATAVIATLTPSG